MDRLVIFDLDGTLIDTIADLGAAANHALALSGYPQHTVAEYAAKVGDGVRNLVTRALPEEVRGNTAIVERTLGIFREYYSSHIDVHTRPYAGITEMLQSVRKHGIGIAVATNKAQEAAERLICKLFPDVEFDLIYGSREGCALKPDASVVLHILDKTGTMPQDALYVGDTEIDMMTARNGGVSAVGITWGYRRPECLTGAAALAETPETLEKLILDRLI